MTHQLYITAGAMVGVLEGLAAAAEHQAATVRDAAAAAAKEQELALRASLSRALSTASDVLLEHTPVKPERLRMLASDLLEQLSLTVAQGGGVQPPVSALPDAADAPAAQRQLQFEGTELLRRKPSSMTAEPEAGVADEPATTAGPPPPPAPSAAGSWSDVALLLAVLLLLAALTVLVGSSWHSWHEGLGAHLQRLAAAVQGAVPRAQQLLGGGGGDRIDDGTL